MANIFTDAQELLKEQEFQNFKRLHEKDSSDFLNKEEDADYFALRTKLRELVQERDRLKDLKGITKYSLDDIFKIYFHGQSFEQASEKLNPALKNFKKSFGEEAKPEKIHFANVKVAGVETPYYLGVRGASEVSEAFKKLTTEKALFDHLTPEGKAYLTKGEAKKRGSGTVYNNLNKFLTTREFDKAKLGKLLGIEVDIRK